MSLIQKMKNKIKILNALHSSPPKNKTKKQNQNYQRSTFLTSQEQKTNRTLFFNIEKILLFLRDYFQQ